MTALSVIVDQINHKIGRSPKMCERKANYPAGKPYQG
jgi:hypothetical protein